MPLFDGSSSATLTGDVAAGGAITGGTISPITNVLSPFPGVTNTVTLTQDSGTPVTGTYNLGNGATTLNATFDSSVVVAGSGATDGTCNYNNVAYTMDTANAVPHAGEPFDNPGGLEGNGAISGSANLPAGTGDAATCAFLGAALGTDPDQVEIWLGHDILPSDSPVPFNQAFPTGLLNVGLLQNLNIDPANARYVGGTIQGTGGGASTATIGVDPAEFLFDPVTVNPTGTPIQIDMTLDAPGIGAGTFDASNGAMTLTGGLYTVTSTINPGPGQIVCTSNANPLDLSTESPQGTAPNPGTRFSHLSGNGALSVSWSSLDTDGSPQCAQIDAAAYGPIGGMWISRGLHPQRTLTVSPTGTGTGTITGPGINCPGDCTESYADGTEVNLSASPGGGSTFTGWTGDCSGTGPCQVTMSANRNVQAGFDSNGVGRTLSVSPTGTGTGTITGPGINCPGDCTETYDDGEVVNLSASPGGGSNFTGWTGDCSGTGPCQVTMSANRNVPRRIRLRQRPAHPDGVPNGDRDRDHRGARHQLPR